MNSYADYPSVLYLPLIFFLLCCGCAAPERSAFFVEVAAEAGLDFRHTSGASGDYFLIETMGAGAAFFDYDDDGWLDVYLVDGFDLSPWRERLVPVNLVAGDSAGTWVIEDFRPPLRYDGRVDTSVLALRQAPNVRARREIASTRIWTGASARSPSERGQGIWATAWGVQSAITTMMVVRIST